MPARGWERREDGYNYRRKLRVWLAGLAAPIFLAVVAWLSTQHLEWYTFSAVLKEWKPSVEQRLENHDARLRFLETQQDEKFDKIMRKLDKMEKKEK